MGLEQKQFEESLRKYVNAFAPPPDCELARKWLDKPESGDAQKYFQCREQAREYFYQQMNKHIAKLACFNF